MMRVHVCGACRCELSRIEVGNGRALVLCVACETIGNAHEVALGARLTAVGQAPQRRRVTPPRSDRRTGSGRPPAGR